MTDGQFPFRHHLHLEACRKKVKLSEHFYSFCDLRKEVKKAVKHDSDFKNLEDVACCILSFGLELCNISTFTARWKSTIFFCLNSR